MGGSFAEAGSFHSLAQGAPRRSPVRFPRRVLALTAVFFFMSGPLIRDLQASLSLYDLPTYSLVPPSLASNVSSTGTQHRLAAGSCRTDSEWLPSSAAPPRTIVWQGLRQMNNLVMGSFKGNYFCEQMIPALLQDQGLNLTFAEWKNNTFWQERVAASTEAKRPALALNMTFNCQELFVRSSAGSGNFIATMYAIRTTARAVGPLDLHISCTDAEQQKAQLILPWLMGYFPGTTTPVMAQSSTDSAERPRLPSPRQACGTHKEVPIGILAREMQDELRRMALAMVGLPPPHHPNRAKVEAFARFLQQQQTPPPLAPEPQLAPRKVMQLTDPWSAQNHNITHPPPPPLVNMTEWDDSIIHFRCGDLMYRDHKGFGLTKFSSYADFISPEATRIGIVTQPFDSQGHQARQMDTAMGGRCRILVESLVRYLQQRFPRATVSVHNDAHETLPLTYSRMIMANQTRIVFSSFGVYAALASFGTAYISQPFHEMSPNRWVMHEPRLDALVDNVVLVKEHETLMGAAVRDLWKRGEARILDWFWDRSPPVRN